MKKYDIAIIGGGPAGSTAAIYLHKVGFDVCLIEKRAFPRETLCGEFLSKEVTQNLKDLKLFEKFLLLNPNPISSFKFFYDNGKHIDVDLEFPAFGLKRGNFDNFLLNCVKEKGIAVFQPSEVHEIIREGDTYTLFIDGGTSLQEIYANKIIGAYGKQNILDKYLNRSFIYNKSSLNGIKFHFDETLFNGLDKKAIQIYTSKGIYCGINYVDEKKVTVCFLENRKESKSNPREQLKTLMKTNKSFGNLFDKRAEQFINDMTIYGTGNIYFGKRELVVNGIYMIGDSAAVIAPLAGDGIGMAFQSALLIAEVFQMQRAAGMDNEETEKFYIQEWKRTFKRRLYIAKLLQDIILNNYSRKIGFLIVSNFIQLLPKIIRSTRSG
jgi:flavin-dependent dehydrogenase